MMNCEVKRVSMREILARGIAVKQRIAWLRL